MAKESKKAKLLGIGLDGKDGHARVTRAENFHLVGGSEETHEKMQEQCIHFNEKLTRRGKRLENLERQELRELAGECQMNLVLPEEGR